MTGQASKRRLLLFAALCALSLVGTSKSFAANNPFLVPVLIGPPEPVQGDTALSQSVRPVSAAALLADFTPGLEKWGTVNASDVLVGGTVGQGTMYCSSPKPKHSYAAGMAFCFRDAGHTGYFDGWAKQVQNRTRDRSVFEAGFSTTMQWEPIHLAYRILPDAETPLIPVKIRAASTNGRQISIVDSICFPSQFHHSEDGGALCGEVAFSPKFNVQPYGLKLSVAQDGQPARFTNGPVDVDFSPKADGNITSSVVHSVPTGPATLRISGQIRSGYGGSVIDSSIFLLTPASVDGGPSQ